MKKYFFAGLFALIFPIPAFATVAPVSPWEPVLMYGLPFVIIGILSALCFWISGWKKLVGGVVIYVLLGIGYWFYFVGFVFELAGLIEVIATWPLILLPRIF